MVQTKIGEPRQSDIENLIGLINEQRLNESATFARELLLDYPKHGFIWKVLSTALKQMGQLQEALIALKKAAEYLPDDPGIFFNLGNAMMLRAQYKDAVEYYQRATQIFPAYAEAFARQANALAASGHLTDAIGCYKRALSIKADLPDAHRGIGFALMSLERRDEAEAHFREVLNQQPHDGLALNSLAVILRSRGQLAQAEVYLRQALQYLPDFAEANNNLGNTLRDLSRNDEAELYYLEALRINPQFPDACFNLGNCLQDQNRLSDAEQYYRRAISLKPDFYQAINNLGNVVKNLGRIEESRECFEKALVVHPDFIEAQCNLAPLKTYQMGDAGLARFEARQTHVTDLPVAARIRYWFALGKIYEDVGRYDDAFAAYDNGNRLQHQRYPVDEDFEDGYLDRTLSFFNADFFSRQSPSAPRDKLPIFIVGMPRSGTSLIEQILASYPGIHGAGELTLLSDLLNSVVDDFELESRPYPQLLEQLSSDQIKTMGDTYIRRIRQLAPDAERITDKMPANFFHIGMIHLMMPQAKIIHAMRDPMDSCFSCYSRLFNHNNLNFAYDLGTVGRYYVRYRKMMNHWHNVLPPGTILDLPYESMVADTEGQAKRLLDYLGLPWDERCLDFHRNQRIVKTASVAQVRRPVYQSSVARWKHFENHLSPLMDIVKDYR